MLVITRGEQERIVIDHAGERMELVVVRASNSRVRIGVEAPQSFHIVRKELAEHAEPGTEAQA